MSSHEDASLRATIATSLYLFGGWCSQELRDISAADIPTGPYRQCSHHTVRDSCTNPIQKCSSSCPHLEIPSVVRIPAGCKPYTYHPPFLLHLLSYRLLIPDISYRSFSSISTPTIRLITAFRPFIFSYVFNQWVARYYLAGTYIQRKYRYSPPEPFEHVFRLAADQVLGCIFSEHTGINVLSNSSSVSSLLQSMAFKTQARP